MSAANEPIASPAATLRELFDVLLLDLDGTVYQGKNPIEGAVDALRLGSEKQYFVTNNASRSPSDVAEHLVDLGFDTSEKFVVTSAQVAARMLAERIPAGSAVVVVGTDALAQEVALVGLKPVRSADEGAVAVVQGHSAETGWSILAEATLAIRGGALWVAANTDATLPTERGLAPGNGAMVSAVRAATGQEPLVAGKPAAPIMDDAIRSSGARRPLVVGDRLDTDIAGANATAIASLLVLTGVSSAVDVLRADHSERPHHIGFDLDILNQSADTSAIGSKPGWSAEIEGDVLVIVHDGTAPIDTLGGLLTAAASAWENTGSWNSIRVVGAGTEELRRLLEL
ncbi:MAG: HAD-IIA family hydrolase [Rhodococcus sp. (in: high G+C Gram-positive bacteria)]